MDIIIYEESANISDDDWQRWCAAVSDRYVECDGIKYHKRFIKRWAMQVLEWQKQHGNAGADQIAQSWFSDALLHAIAIKVWEYNLYGYIKD